MSFFPTADNLSSVALQPDEDKVLVTIAPAGIEKFFEELSALSHAASGTPDLHQVKELAKHYNIEILVHEDA